MNTAILVVCGAIGAPARYLVDTAVSRRASGPFPWGTLVVNVTGAFVLGVVYGLVHAHGLPEGWATALGTGFCGAYTTFSTFSYETVRLVENGAAGRATRYVVASVLTGLIAAGAGLVITGAW